MNPKKNFATWAKFDNFYLPPCHSAQWPIDSFTTPSLSMAPNDNKVWKKFPQHILKNSQFKWEMIYIVIWIILSCTIFLGNGKCKKTVDVRFPFLSLRHSGLEGMGLVLTSSPPPHPPSLPCPCLLRLVALLPSQGDRESRPWCKDKDQAGCGRQALLVSGFSKSCKYWDGNAA